MKVGMIFGNGVSGKGAKEVLEKMKYEVVMVDDNIIPSVASIFQNHSIRKGNTSISHNV